MCYAARKVNPVGRQCGEGVGQYKQLGLSSALEKHEHEHVIESRLLQTKPARRLTTCLHFSGRRNIKPPVQFAIGDRNIHFEVDLILGSISDRLLIEVDLLTPAKGQWEKDRWGEKQ